MTLRHLQWLIAAPVANPEVVVYEVLPYAPAPADGVIEQLCALAGDDPARAERLRQAFQVIVAAAGARQVARAWRLLTGRNLSRS